MSVNFTPTPIAAGSIPSATALNNNGATPWAGIQAAWTAYTPTMTAWGLVDGTLVGKYMQVGKTIKGRIEYTIGAGDTLSAGSPTWALPVAAANNVFANPGPTIGRVCLYDSSGPVRNYYDACLVSTTAMRPLSNTGTGVSNSLPWTWAAGDVVQFDFDYEAV